MLDQIDALDQLDGLQITDEQQACMRDVVGTYENGALDDIATAGNNEDINWNDENALASGSPELQEFVERLGVCVSGEAESTETTDSSDTTEASDTTGASETTESADTTESTDTTEASETTEAVDTTEA